LVLIFMLCQELPSLADAGLHIYKPGTKYLLTAKWLGLSADGTIEVLDNREFDGRETIFIRSQVTELGGLLGFAVKFLRVYKESNTFDSYIDSDTLMPVQYEVYELKDDGSKKITERIRFDRKQNRIVSLVDDKVVVNNAPPDVQDASSIFLDLISKFNKEELFLGRRFRADLYAQKKITKIEVVLVQQSLLNGRTIHTFEIAELPSLFVYPASIRFKVTDVGGGFMFVTEGSCTIHIPVLPDVTVRARMKEVKRGG